MVSRLVNVALGGDAPVLEFLAQIILRLDGFIAVAVIKGVSALA